MRNRFEIVIVTNATVRVVAIMSFINLSRVNKTQPGSSICGKRRNELLELHLQRHISKCSLCHCRHLTTIQCNTLDIHLSQSVMFLPRNSVNHTDILTWENDGCCDHCADAVFLSVRLPTSPQYIAPWALPLPTVASPENNNFQCLTQGLFYISFDNYYPRW